METAFESLVVSDRAYYLAQRSIAPHVAQPNAGESITAHMSSPVQIRAAVYSLPLEDMTHEL